MFKIELPKLRLLPRRIVRFWRFPQIVLPQIALPRVRVDFPMEGQRVYNVTLAARKDAAPNSYTMTVQVD